MAITLPAANTRMTQLGIKLPEALKNRSMFATAPIRNAQASSDVIAENQEKPILTTMQRELDILPTERQNGFKLLFFAEEGARYDFNGRTDAVSAYFEEFARLHAVHVRNPIDIERPIEIQGVEEHREVLTEMLDGLGLGTIQFLSDSGSVVSQTFSNLRYPITIDISSLLATGSAPSMSAAFASAVVSKIKLASERFAKHTVDYHVIFNGADNSVPHRRACEELREAIINDERMRSFFDFAKMGQKIFAVGASGTLATAFMFASNQIGAPIPYMPAMESLGVSTIVVGLSLAGIFTGMNSKRIKEPMDITFWRTHADNQVLGWFSRSNKFILPGIKTEQQIPVYFSEPKIS